MATQMRGINLVRKGTESRERALGAELWAGRGGRALFLCRAEETESSRNDTMEAC